ncbi:MAG TPA: metallophosphoesterase family protein [bacterium]|nr:metallophosphoesterase family protein [bacterium]
MRVAIFSDVHGNLRALAAVLAEMQARGPFDQVINGGDLAFGGPRPREAMDLLMQGGYPTVLGNTDVWIAGIEEGGGSVVAWARQRLTPRHEAFLRALPSSYRLEPPGGPPLVVVHATPTSLSDVLEPDAPPHEIARLFEQAHTHVLVYGHIHRPYAREVAGGLVVNTGSVGFPFDGIPKPSFAICELSGGRWRAEIVRVDYDLEAVAQELTTNAHPDGATFARRLRIARVSG